MPAMNPTKMLIAQRLAEHAREGRAIVSLMEEPFADDPRWAGVASDLAIASETADYWAKEIRSDEVKP